MHEDLSPESISVYTAENFIIHLGVSMKTVISLLVFFGLALAGSNPAFAQTLIGSEYGGQTIYEINGATGDANPIGGGTTNRLPGLAYNPNTDILYGTDENSLFTVNPSNGTTSLVGPHGAQIVTSLAFDAGYTTLYSIGYNGILYTINPATGAQTAIGPLGASPNTILALATNSAGTVYGTGTSNNLYTVNTSTGAATVLGTMTGTSIGLTAIAFDENDTLYAIDTGTDRLLTIDVNTLVATPVGTTGIGSDIRGLAVVAAGAGPGPVGPAQPIPSLSTLGLITLSLILGMVGLASAKRRRLF